MSGRHTWGVPPGSRQQRNSQKIGGMGQEIDVIIRMVFARVSEGGGIESIGEVEGQRAERGEIVLREKSVESKSKRQKNGNVCRIEERGDNSARRGNGRNWWRE